MSATVRLGQFVFARLTPRLPPAGATPENRKRWRALLSPRVNETAGWPSWRSRDLWLTGSTAVCTPVRGPQELETGCCDHCLPTGAYPSSEVEYRDVVVGARAHDVGDQGSEERAIVGSDGLVGIRHSPRPRPMTSRMISFVPPKTLVTRASVQALAIRYSVM